MLFLLRYYILERRISEERSYNKASYSELRMFIVCCSVKDYHVVNAALIHCERK